MTGNQKKGNPFYIVAERVAELCLAIMYKEKLANKGLGYLAEEISTKVVRSSFFLLQYYKE